MEDEQAVYLLLGSENQHLIPIVTVVIYFETEHWDVPRSLHEMFLTKDETVLNLVPDLRT